jgi:predicted metal-dependent peptidase
MRGFNVAHDIAINRIILNSGFELPDFALLAGKAPFEEFPEDKSAEEYYNMLPESMKSGNKNGDKEDEGGCGSVRKPGSNDGKGGSPSDLKELEADWKQAVCAASAMARQKGKLPSDIDRLVAELTNPVVDWESQLRQYVVKHATSDYSWSRPSRRFVGQGMHLPSMFSEELGEIVIAIDSSGSIGEKQISRFLSEMTGICECLPCKVWILLHHAEVYSVSEWSPENGPITIGKLKTGGTSHIPVFKVIEERQMEPVCAIMLTDCITEFPKSAPAFDVIWAVVDNDSPKVPFGNVLDVRV